MHHQSRTRVGVVTHLTSRVDGEDLRRLVLLVRERDELVIQPLPQPLLCQRNHRLPAGPRPRPPPKLHVFVRHGSQLLANTPGSSSFATELRKFYIYVRTG